jgi:YhcH/YjgK/YiaL family protein
MIIDELQNSDRYLTVHPGFRQAFAFLRRPDLKDLAVGRHAIDGDRIYAIVARDPGGKKDQAQLETHERYIDVQLVVDGCDNMGWRPKSQCGGAVDVYDSDRDIQFFNDPPLVFLPVGVGMFAVFFPEDAHQPLIGEGTIGKVIVKVAVAG